MAHPVICEDPFFTLYISVRKSRFQGVRRIDYQHMGAGWRIKTSNARPTCSRKRLLQLHIILRLGKPMMILLGLTMLHSPQATQMERWSCLESS